VDKALRLEVKSRQDGIAVPEKVPTAPPIQEEDSFFSRLYHTLQKLK
jgi:hypothetical protein